MHHSLANYFRTLLRGPRQLEKTPANHRQLRGKRRRSLGFELCEDRHLLSGASITGTIYNTANASGFSAGDTPQSGVWVDLYKDNGDGVFNSATDTRVDREKSVTGTGLYTFNSVADGHYYIQEEVPAGFNQMPARRSTRLT